MPWLPCLPGAHGAGAGHGLACRHAQQLREASVPRHTATFPLSDEGAVAVAAGHWKMASRDMMTVLRHAANVDGSAAGMAAASAFAQVVREATYRLQVAAALLATSTTGSATPSPPSWAFQPGVSAAAKKGDHVVATPDITRRHWPIWQAGKPHQPSTVDYPPRWRLRRSGEGAPCPNNDADWHELLSTWASPIL